MSFPGLEMFWKNMKYPKSFGKAMEMFNNDSIDRKSN